MTYGTWVVFGSDSSDALIDRTRSTIKTDIELNASKIVDTVFVRVNVGQIDGAKLRGKV